MKNKRLSRRDFLFVAGTAALGTAIAACAPKTTATPAAGQAENTPANAPTKANEIMEINFWNGVGPPEGTLLEEFVYDYQTKHPELKINQWTTDWDPFYTKIRTVAAEGVGPDLCVTHPNYLATYADIVFKPIDDLVSVDKDIKPELFNQVPWDACFRNGKQYAIPMDAHLLCLYYNIDLLQKAGVNPPQSDNDLVEVAKSFTKSPDQWGINTWFSGNGIYWTWLAYMSHYGQKGMLNSDNTKAVFNNDAGASALQRIYDNIYTDKFSPGPDLGVDFATAFSQQKMAFCYDGTWMKFTWDAAKLNYSSVMFTKQQPGTWGNSHIFVFPRLGGAPKTQVAWDMAKYIVLNHSVDWGLKAGHVPALKSADQDPAYLATMPQMQGFVDMLPYLVYLPRVPQQEAIGAEMQGSLSSVLRKEVSVKDALKKSEAKVNQLLATPL